MTIISSDGKAFVEVGSSRIWQALSSTVAVRLAGDKEELRLAKRFLETTKCNSEDALKTARSMNFLRDALSSISPENLVYDARDLKKEAPWVKEISPVITSCGNYFITADGKDLFSELVSILTYAYYAKTDIETIG